MKYTILIIVLIFTASSVSAQWIKQIVNTTASFRGVSVVGDRTVWASGTDGTVIRTTDSGKTWKVIRVPGAADLDFRDIEAFSGNTAYVLSIGNGDKSRIYKTVNGGDTWTLQFINRNEKAFFNAIACWDQNTCVAMSDPVDGRFILVSTSDGINWSQPGSDRRTVPMVALEGEVAFAASGTCLVAYGKTDLYLVTGGSEARVFSSKDRGSTWTIAEPPMIKGSPGRGIFSIAMANKDFGMIVGGDYEKPELAERNVAVTVDGGFIWAARAGLTGYRSGVAFVDEKTVIAVGPNGTDLSSDQGVSWRKISSEHLNAIDAKGPTSVWAVGPNGTVVKLR